MTNADLAPVDQPTDARIVELTAIVQKFEHTLMRHSIGMLA